MEVPQKVKIELCYDPATALLDTYPKDTKKQGSLGGAAVWRLPLAQGAILETQDRIPRRTPGAWSLLLLLPMSLPLSLSLSVTIINK